LQLGLALRRAATKAERGIAFPIPQLIAGETVVAPERHVSAAGKNGRTVSQVKERRKVTSDLFHDQIVEQREGEPLWEQVRRLLPFTLTNAQHRVIEEIWGDMAR
ncbi:MAG: hypothetical protein C4320_03850, partial [Armatimonadota bacterium]